MKHYMPVRVFSGEGAVEKNAAFFEGLGSRCALITGRSAAVKSGALADARAALISARDLVAGHQSGKLA